MNCLGIAKVKYCFKFVEQLVSSITCRYTVWTKCWLKTKKAYVGSARFTVKKNLNISRSVNFKEMRLCKISNEVMKNRGVRYLRKISLSKWTHNIKRGLHNSIKINIFKYIGLSPWSIVLRKKLTGSQLDKKVSAFYETRSFITAFQTVRDMALSSPISIQSMPPIPRLKYPF
jgi:hypothetical protein